MRYLALILLLLGLVACNKPTPNTLTIGTISGPETDLVETAKEVALKNYGLNIKIVEFNDYNLPNEALEDGSLDANVYQHLPYLQAAIEAHGYTLEALGKTFIYPMGLYSKKHASLNKLKKQAIIAIPNDPGNETRALLLLQKAGFIRLKKGASATATVNDIVYNPKKLQIKELDAAQLPRILEDVDAAIINTTFAIPAGLKLSKDALLVEPKTSPYANLIVIKKGAENKEKLLQFVKAFQSKEVSNKAKELFGEAAVPAW